MQRAVLNDRPRELVLLLILGMPLAVLLGWGWYPAALVVLGIVAAVATFDTF